MKMRLMLLMLLAAACRSTPSPKASPGPGSPVPQSATAPPRAASPSHTAQETALKARAARPGADAETHLARALAAWHLDNAPAQAQQHLGRALTASPGHPRALLMACAMANAQRNYPAFLEACARVVELAASSPEAVGALAYLDHGRGQHQDWAPRVGAAVAAALDRCPKSNSSLGACADVAAVALRSGMWAAASRGDATLWQALAGRAGLLTTFKVAGPYAPPEVDEMRTRSGLAQHGIPDQIPPPPRSGGVFHVAPRKLLDGQLQPARLGTRGIYAVQSWVHQPRPARVFLEVRATSAFRVYVDGLKVLEFDAWDQQASVRHVVSLGVVPGWHRVSLDVAAEPNDRVELRWLSDAGTSPLDLQAADLPPNGKPSPAPTLLNTAPLADRALLANVEKDPGDVEAALGVAVMALTLDEGWRARDVMERAAAGFPSSARVQQLLASALEDDVTLPANVRQARARQACDRALALEPGNLICRYRMAVWDQQSRPDDALDGLRAVASERPDYPHVWRSLFDVYRARGWNVEAAAALEKALALGAVDGVADPGAAFFASVGNHARARALRERAARVVDSPSSARWADLLVDRLEDAAALKEWDRLLVQSPDHPEQSDRLVLLQRSGDLKALRDGLEKHLVRFPGDGDAQLQLCGVQRAVGDLKAAVACVTRVRTFFPALTAVERLALGPLPPEPGEDPTLPPADVAALLKELDAQLQAQPVWLKDAATVVLLDHGRTVVRGDGSALTVKHRVIRVGTRDAADELGEIQLGSNEERRLLRVITADGRVVEPEVGQGKATISLSSLGPGDTLELRTVTMGDNAPPLNVFQEHFFFADRFPTLRSEYVLDVPRGAMDVLQVTARGVDAPQVSVQGDLVRHIWRNTFVPAARQEPASAPAHEHLPYVGVVLRGGETLDAVAVCRRLAGTGRMTPELREAAASLKASGKDAQDILDGALRLVRQRVEPDLRPWSAGESLAGGRGWHFALVRALLREAGVPARAVVASSVVTPQVNLPQLNRRDVLLLVVPTAKADVVLATVGAALVPAPWPPVLVAGSALEADCDEPARLGQVYALPPPTLDAWENTAEANITVQQQGVLDGSVVMRVVDPSAAALRKDVAAATQEQLAQWLGGVVQPWLAGVELTGVETSNLAARDGPLELKLGVRSTAAAQSHGTIWVWEGVLQRPMLTGVAGGFPPEDYLRAGLRTTPLLVSRPMRERAVFRINLPAGAVLVRGPRNFDAAGEGFRVTQQVTVQGETITITRVTRVDPVRIGVQQFPAWRAAVEKMLQDGNNRLEWSLPPAATNARGRARP